MTRPIRERFIRQGPRSLSEKRHFRGMYDPCDPDHTSLEYLVIDADDRLFNLILYSKYNVLHSILPHRSDFNYNLRPRCHNLVLTAKSSSITDRDYITRMIVKNNYWCWSIHLLFSVFPSTCLGLGYCYCLSLYILFFKIYFSICIHFTLYRCGLSTWVSLDWLIDWLSTPWTIDASSLRTRRTQPIARNMPSRCGDVCCRYRYCSSLFMHFSEIIQNSTTDRRNRGRRRTGKTNITT